jgi:aryl-alcohol dehydrogenase-like predicted oxidoreductase
MSARTIILGDYEVNRIGLGTNRLSDTQGNRHFIRLAVEAGVSLIDTAHRYTGGESEQVIGAALAPFPDDLVVATKAATTPAAAGPSDYGTSSRRASHDSGPTRSPSTTSTGSTRGCRSKSRWAS